ncbi:MAG: OmpA family protein [Sphingobacteriales bacterium]|nr:OmpA family protein [Sphingobacteriales bacterium]
MRKFIFLLFTSLLFFNNSYNQIKVRLIGGPQQADIKETNSIPDWNTITSPWYKKRNGFHAGIVADIPFKTGSKAFFQPGFIFSSKGRIFDKIYDTLIDPNFRVKSTTAVNYMEIPLNLGYKLPLGKKIKFVVSAGPYAGLFYSGKETTETTDKLFTYTKEETKYQTGKGENKFKSLDLGINATAGFDFGGVTLTGRYTRSLVNNFTASYNGSFKHEVLGASLGINLKTIREKKLKPIIKDRDNDGVNDELDACPDIAGTVKGCPDKDKDGVADKDDKCPDVTGLVKYNGCPIPDTDGDGINDEADKCPSVAGLAKYNGCPAPDRDKDGIADDEDKCPDVAGLANYNGCPAPDRDKDGITDEEDQCPDQPGRIENHGCPEVKQELKKKIDEAARKVFFDFGSSKIKKESFKVLEEVAKLLQENGELRLIIEGHTDNVGTAERNKIRSQERADTIKNFLLSKGVTGNRLTATGYGFDKPVADNTTASGRAQNRRVEMKLSY